MKHQYTVQLQDGRTGEIVECDYIVGWNPEKVDPSDVAEACAAEKTCESGKIKTPEGPQHARIFAGLSAVYRGPVEAFA